MDVWLPVDDVVLVIEIGPEAAGTGREYAGAGIPQYWTVDREAGQTVTMHRLAKGGYEIVATTPLNWVLNTAPEDHLGSPGPHAMGGW